MMLKNEIIRYFGRQESCRVKNQQLEANIDQFIIKYLTRADLAKKNKLLVWFVLFGWLSLLFLSQHKP